MFLAGSALIAMWFATLVVTNEGVAYRCVFTRVVFWKDVTRVRVAARQREVTIFTRTSKLSVSHYFELGRIIPTVFEGVREQAPSSVIEDLRMNSRGATTTNRLDA